MKTLQKIRNTFSRISIIDKFLLIFLFFFLVQITYGLFVSLESSAQTNSIDAIIRTFTSTVFGYFLSGRFSDSPSGNITLAIPPKATQTTPTSPSSIQNKIGFSDIPADKTDSGNAVLRTVPVPASKHMFQTMIVASVGLISLIIILILRNTSAITDAMTAPLTQLRDMLSSSIGFLIGSKNPLNAD